MNRLDCNTSPILNSYAIIYPLIWSIPFYKSIVSKTSYRTCIGISAITCMAGILFYFSRIDFFREFNGPVLAIGSTHLIISVLLYISYVAMYSEDLNLRKHPLILIGSILLVYSAFCAVIFALMNQFDAQTYFYLWTYRSISFIILNLVIAFVFFSYGRSRI